MKNPNWNPAENNPCKNCPSEKQCNLAGLEMTCETLALADKNALKG